MVEIGLAYGVSAMAFAEALVTASNLRHATHLIIDAFQDQFGDAGWNAIEAAGFSGVCSLIQDALNWLCLGWLPEGFIADAAFVDGSHIFHDVFVDLAYLREMDPESRRAGDPRRLRERPSVATAVRYFELNTGWQPQPLETTTRRRRLPAPLILASNRGSKVSSLLLSAPARGARLALAEPSQPSPSGQPCAAPRRRGSERARRHERHDRATYAPAAGSRTTTAVSIERRAA